MDDAFYNRKLAAIGVPFSLNGEIDQTILPERALCEAAPIFYRSYKSTSLTMTMLLNCYDLFRDDILAREISIMSDRLAVAMLCGVLIKANATYFHRSIATAKQMARNFDRAKIDRSLYALLGKFPHDHVLSDNFGIEICEIEICDPKKTTPREYMPSKNAHFAQRSKSRRAAV